MLGGRTLPDEARCIACDQALYFLPDSYPLCLHCENGHFWTVGDLLDQFAPANGSQDRSALQYWQEKGHLFHQLAARAFSDGHPLVASDFQDTAGRIDRWLGNLERLLDKSARSPSPHRRAREES